MCILHVGIRDNGIGFEEWCRLAEALSCCALLVEVADFAWSQTVLLHGISHLCLSGSGLCDSDAAVLAALLPRASQTLVSLRLE